MRSSTSISSTCQFYLFKDCLARRILQYQTVGGGADDASDSALDDFVTYLTTEAWPTLPSILKEATYEGRDSLYQSIPDVESEDALSLDSTSAAFIESLVSYGIVSDDNEALRFLRKALVEYVVQACAPPPVWSLTRTKECEICQREVPLTYHHLIPKSVHAKVLKKGWHPESMLNSVAWLCRYSIVLLIADLCPALFRPCHSVVHQVASCEDLARNLYTVELLLEREDIQRWQKYAAKQRYGVRRG
ncbi:unnamed protein product [Cyclocybe aegerita]|uniref:Uncharacterized protein n=1 Tax=Cyclocybe aegerita TaxID=1973307 RepID=A0A8S0WYL3_CYCAE|nr:unnamed protein product [Cyclocybe aegerita]